MTFLNPLMLIGAMTGVLPIIFHFIYKRTAEVHPFPAVRFLTNSRKRSVFFSRLEELLLLLIRLFIIILISAAFARPVISDINISHHNEKYITALIIDDSYSMDYEIQDSTAFELGKDVAKKFVESTFVKERVFIIWTSDNDMNVIKKKEPGKNDLIKEIDEKNISYLQNSFTDILSIAVDILLKAPAAVKRIIFITDSQKSLWTASDKDRLRSISDDMRKNSIGFFLVDMTPLQETSNIAIEDVSLHNRSLNGQNGIDINVDARNYSKKPVRDIMVSIYLNNEKAAESFIHIGPDEKIIKKTFVPIKDSAKYTGRVSIGSGDSLHTDDERYFSLSHGAAIRVLVVDGDPRPYPFDSESFYLMNALMPGMDSGTAIFEPVLATSDILNSKRLKKYDVIVFCNVQYIPENIIKSVTRLVAEAGRGVLFTLGSHTDHNRYNKIFKDLLPVKLRGIKRLKNAEYEHITDKRLDHPLLEIFKLPDTGDFSRTVFKKYFLIQQSYAKDTEYLLSLSKGSPYLIIGNKGNGKTALITSTIDREWNDFPIQTTFLPLMHQVMFYLSNSLEQFKEDVKLGDEKQIRVKDGIKDITIINPEGKKTNVEIYTQENGRIGKFADTYYPGIYKVRYSREDKTNKIGSSEEYFAVNINTRHESNLSKIDEKELAELLGENSLKRISFDQDKDINEIIRKSSASASIWSSLILVVLALFFTESLLLSGVLKKRRKKNQNL